ncbi:flagellin [Lysinibacillus sp. 2017]|uniref:flagellin n=1 Tax=unclassified Lysinibacillus TaxID=2636778 RepID=UPI003518D0C5
MGTTSDNLTAAESRIRDTDMAAEMMNFTKQNILMQAAQSILAKQSTTTRRITTFRLIKNNLKNNLKNY